MSDTPKRNSKGQYLPGQKPVGAGRNKGTKVTPLSDEKLAKLLGRRTESAIEELGLIAMMDLEEVKDSPQKLNANLKAIMGLLTQDDKARDRVHKKAMDAIKNKLDAEKAKSEAKANGSATVSTAPIVQLTAMNKD